MAARRVPRDRRGRRLNAFAARRRFVAGAAALAAAPAFLRHALAADAPRFALGVASGQPRADGMVLWTRLTGEALADRVDVRWEVALDEGFRQIVARGDEPAEAAWGHSVHAEPGGLEPGRWYFYRFTALGDRSTIGRTRTAPAPDAAATLRLALGSCQRFDTGHYAAWRQVAADAPDLVAFVGDYIYESAQRADPVRLLPGGNVRTLDGYRARYATHKSDVNLQAAHAAAPWLVVWDDHEVQNDYAGLVAYDLDPTFATRRAAAYQAYWENMPFPKSARPSGADMRIYGRLDWGRLARIHLLDDRQYRDPQACPKPGRSGSNTLPLGECAAFRDPKRSLLGTAQERWIDAGWDPSRPWNLLVQQTLVSRFTWQDPADGKAVYWNDGWDGYAPARDRLLAPVAAQKISGLVVLGGDVHSHYVADVKADFDDPRSPILATEFCGTSISSLGLAQSRLDAARRFNPHIHYARSDQRGYVAFEIDIKGIDVRLQVVDRPADPMSTVSTAARYRVDPAQPGVHAA